MKNLQTILTMIIVLGLGQALRAQWITWDEPLFTRRVPANNRNAMIFTLSPDESGNGRAFQYERYLGKDGLSRDVNFFTRFTTGHSAQLFDARAPYVSAELGLLTGKSIDHLEITGGLGLHHTLYWKRLLRKDALDEKVEERFEPQAYVGWRHQKPNKGMIYRIGYCYPLGVQFGIGLAY